MFVVVFVTMRMAVTVGMTTFVIMAMAFRFHVIAYHLAKATFFVMKTMEAWTSFVKTLDAVPEGDGTLLDNCLVLAHSETSEANTHSVVGLPFMTAGTAGGKVKTGLHVNGIGESCSRVGLTMQQAMGLNVGQWGTDQNQTDRTISEILT